MELSDLVSGFFNSRTLMLIATLTGTTPVTPSTSPTMHWKPFPVQSRCEVTYTYNLHTVDPDVKKLVKLVKKEASSTWTDYTNGYTGIYAKIGWNDGEIKSYRIVYVDRSSDNEDKDGMGSNDSLYVEITRQVDAYKSDAYIYGDKGLDACFSSSEKPDYTSNMVRTMDIETFNMGQAGQKLFAEKLFVRDVRELTALIESERK